MFQKTPTVVLNAFREFFLQRSRHRSTSRCWRRRHFSLRSQFFQSRKHFPFFVVYVRGKTRNFKLNSERFDVIRSFYRTSTVKFNWLIIQQNGHAFIIPFYTDWFYCTVCKMRKAKKNSITAGNFFFVCRSVSSHMRIVSHREGNGSLFFWFGIIVHIRKAGGCSKVAQ